MNMASAISDERDEAVETNSTISNLTTQVHLFMEGLFDAIAFHRTFHVLVNHHDILMTVLKIFGANAALILGSVAFFRKGILPLANVINEKAFDIHDQTHYDSMLWLIYQGLWLIPICVLCYICCLAWYQELADGIHKNYTAKNEDDKKGSKHMSSITKSLEYVLYATLAWLFVYIQVQLLLAIVPTLTHWCEDIVEFLIPHDASHMAMLQTFHKGVKYSFFLLTRALKWISLLLGLCLMSVLYAWYAFDPKWIAHQINPDERFAMIEKHLAYFLGFGVPSVLLLKTTSFFVGFGAFLMLFPFWIILGSTTEFASHYEARGVDPVQRYRIFKLSQVWTLKALKFFGADIEKTRKLLDKQKQKRLEQMATRKENQKELKKE
jgi:hypothetical protein